MRFLVIYNGVLDPNGGASGTVWQTNEALKGLGHSVDAICEEEIRRTVSHPNLHNALELPRRILQVARAQLSKAQYDVVLISQPYGYLVGKWLRAHKSETLYLHRSHGHELVVSHELGSWEDAIGAKRSYGRRLASRGLALRLARQARLALKYADGTIVPSTFDRDFLIEQEQVDPRKVRSIFHASVPAYLEAEPKPYTEERHKRLLYVGTFTRRKGADIVWAVGTSLLRRFPDLSLTIVTNKSDCAEARAGFGKDIAQRTAVRDWVTQSELMNIYDEHGLQIIPSLYEGAGKAHYEGMSRGLCLVSSPIGAMRDSITSSEDGWLVPAGDVEGFVQALSHLIDRYDVAREMGEKARRRSQEFTWERNAKEIVAYAVDLLSQRAWCQKETTGQLPEVVSH